MIFNIIRKITGIERETDKPGVSGGIKYAADILLFIVVSFYLIATGVLLPLYLPSYDSLGSDKGKFWISVIKISGKMLLVPLALYVLSFIVAFVKDKQTSGNLREYISKKVKIYPSDIWAAVFCANVIISRALSDEKEIALYGERGWYVGMVSYLALGLAAIIVPRLGKAKNYFLPVIMAGSFAVCLLGILMDLKGNVLHAEGWYGGRISTIGNSNWFCGYLITVMFCGAAAFFLRKEKKGFGSKALNALLVIYMTLAFYMIIGQGSASAYPALFAVILALMIISGKDLKALFKIVLIILTGCLGTFLHAIQIVCGGYSRTNDALGLLLEKPSVVLGIAAAFAGVTALIFIRIKKEKTQTKVNIGLVLTALTGISLLIFILLLIANTGSGVGYLGKEGSVFWFCDEWGAHRGATMKAGWALFKEMTPVEKLFGVGPDNFYSFTMCGRNDETALFVIEYFNGARLTNAHCDPLTMLVNTGLIGAVSYYGLMICVMIKGFKKKNITALSCSLGILAYIINNIFSFQTAVNVSQLALVLAFGAWAVTHDKSEDR